MMVNPYEPPQDSLEGTGTVQGDYHCAWCDRGFLVISTDRAPTLPRRCVVSGVDVPAQSKLQMEVCFPERSIFQRSVTVLWPVDYQKVPAVRPIDVTTWSITLAAVLLFVMGQSAPEHRLSPALFTLWPFCTLAAIFLRCLFVRRFLTLRRIQGQYAWIDGVHPRFLEVLPPWPGETHG